MATIAYVEVTDDDTQHALLELNHRMTNAGVRPEQVINIQRESYMDGDKLFVTIYAFYRKD